MTNGFFEKERLVKNKIRYAFSASNYWSSTENNQNNAWNVNFSSGNINNNNKYNSNLIVRPVAALDEKRKEAWIDAFDDCCRHKKSSDNCIRYRLRYEYDLFKLAYEVESGIYTPSASICFCVTRPKLREIFAANFRDRIVHHWLMMKLNPLFEKRFIEQGNVSFNCRKGFGTMAAVNAVKRDVEEISGGYTKDAFIGRFGIVCFFMSMDREDLIEKLRWFVYENYKEDDVDLVFDTLCKVIRNNPAENCEKHGNVELFLQLDKRKSFFHAKPNKGLPIGNLPSQILANFDLSFFDEAMSKWVSERGGKYERFVDDFVVVMPTMKLVWEAYVFARDFLDRELYLELHEDKKYMQYYGNGVLFVGYVVKYDRTYLSNRTYGHFKDKIANVDKICGDARVRGITEDRLVEINDAIQALNSYTGFSCHVNGYAKTRKILMECKNIYTFAYLKHDKNVLKMRKKYKKGEYLYEEDRLERTAMSSYLHSEEERRFDATHRLCRRKARRRRVVRG